MIYITGDVHGDLLKKNIRQLKKLKKNDVAIICGDFGFIWDNSDNERKALKKLSRYRCNILFVDGSHENHKMIKQYPLTDIYGEKAYKILDNIYCLQRGSIHIIEDKKFLFIGGGQSEYIYMRLYLDMETEFRDEFIKQEDVDNAFNNLLYFDNQVDYVVTHEAPLKIKEFLDLEDNFETSHCNVVLQDVCDKINFKKWFFGHYHIDKVVANKYIAIYDNVIKLDK